MSGSGANPLPSIRSFQWYEPDYILGKLYIRGVPWLCLGSTAPSWLQQALATLSPQPQQRRLRARCGYPAPFHIGEPNQKIYIVTRETQYVFSSSPSTSTT